MILCRFRTAFSCCMIAALAAGCATRPSTQQVVDKFQRQVANNDVSDVHIFSIPYRILHPAPVTRDRFEANAYYRCDFVLSDPLKSDLLEALKNAKVEKSDRDGDLNWAASFWDDRDKMLFWVYLGRSFTNTQKTNGWINGQSVEMNLSLVKWFEGHFDEKHMPVEDCWAKLLYAPSVAKAMRQ